MIVEGQSFSTTPRKGNSGLQLIYGLVVAVGVHGEIPWVLAPPATVKTSPLAKQIGCKKTEKEQYIRRCSEIFAYDTFKTVDECDAALTAEVGRLCIESERPRTPGLFRIRMELAEQGFMEEDH